jgi:hypothetical protein
MHAMSDPTGLLQGLGLFEYRLVPAGEPLPQPDLSLPLPQPLPAAFQAQLTAAERCLQTWPQLFSDPWLEVDQAPLAGPPPRPALFVRLVDTPGSSRPHRTLKTLNAALWALMAALGMGSPPQSLPSLPAGLGFSHIGLFPATPAPLQLRCNVVGTPQRQWAWLQQHCTTAVALLQSCGLAGVLLAEPAVAAWSATLDWADGWGPRLGVELYPPGRLQRGSGFGTNEDDAAIAALLQQLDPWLPNGAITRCREWHLQQLPPTYQAGFSHLKVVVEPAAPAPLQLKLYLLGHAAG